MVLRRITVKLSTDQAWLMEGFFKRIPHGTGLDLNPIQRLLPTSMELSMNQNGKSIPPVDLPITFDVTDRTTGVCTTGASNVIPKKVFSYTGVTQQPNKETVQSALFDGLFPSTIEETKNSDDLFTNLNFSENLNQPTSNSSKFWHNTPISFYRDTSNCANTNFLNGPDWLPGSHTFNPVDLLSSQQSVKAVPSHGLHNTTVPDSQSIGKGEDLVDLSDDAFLSTRMVSLLLEEDNASDPIKEPQNGSAVLGGNNADSVHTLTSTRPVSVLETIGTELGALKGKCAE
ncbi:unnamed protein product [Echinostoma caproni]|uniref:Transcription factor GAMYB n=1 Tax=Echinostoma caproni TaxID=27848 RepID=A0A183AZI7_9TREM|nr:unnamed protein product [Echinostoma caproni]